MKNRLYTSLSNRARLIALACTVMVGIICIITLKGLFHFDIIITDTNNTLCCNGQNASEYCLATFQLHGDYYIDACRYDDDLTLVLRLNDKGLLAVSPKDWFNLSADLANGYETWYKNGSCKSNGTEKVKY